MVKQLTGLQLPIIPGGEAIIYLADGSKARTYPKKINDIFYDKEQLWITFTTLNSVYTGVVDVINPSKELYNGQLIKRGATVVSSEGGRETIDDIVWVKKDGIQVRTKTGIFNGKISLRGTKPV